MSEPTIIYQVGDRVCSRTNRNMIGVVIKVWKPQLIMEVAWQDKHVARYRMESLVIRLYDNEDEIPL